MSIATRLTDPDAAVRAQAAGELAAAASGLAEAARGVRDVNAAELLRNGVRPADVGRTIGVTRAQMARFKAGDKPLTRADLGDGANAVTAAVDKLLELLNLAPA